MFRKFLVLVVIVQYIVADETNNVCPTNEAYVSISSNKDCWYDPDVNGVIEDIITHHGYKVESYKVQTSDGYILEIFRIPSALNSSSTDEVKQPLLLYHGVNRDARCFLLVGAKSPALYYASKGYDVWLANSRGTTYSSHVKYTRADKEFWDFSFHEMGIHDVPAIVDQVAKTTNQAGNIIYVGHSMGTSASFVYASENPTHCKKNLKAIISLAPVAKLYHSKVPFVRELSAANGILEDALNLAGIHYINTTYLFKLCPHFPLISICELAIQVGSGFSHPNRYPRIIPIFTEHGDTSVAVRILLHYAQIVKSSGRFQKYDYGSSTNIEKYGSSTPPLYKTGNIPVNVDLIYGNNDFIAVKQDVENFYNQLTMEKKSIRQVPGSNSKSKLAHEDFLFGLTLENEIYVHINAALNKYS